jgi:SNF2 family DNA or RNA helicase
MKMTHALMRRVSRLRPGASGPVPVFSAKEDSSFSPFESSIEVPAPNGLSYLPFQRAGIDFLAQHQAALLADEMGLGKTVEVAGL